MYLRYFATERPLSDGEIEHFINAIQPFFRQWTSHGSAVMGDVMVYENRFVQLRATLQDSSGISGCGIDKAVHEIERIAFEMGVKWANPLHLFVKEGNQLLCLGRNALKSDIQEGKVRPEAQFFNLSATTETEFVKRLGETFFNRYFAAVER